MADVLRAPPRKARSLVKGGALPSAERLARMTPEDLVRTLGRFGIEPDVGAMERRANVAFERLDGLAEQGIEPDEAMWDALDDSVEGHVTKQLRTMTKAAVRNYKLAREEQGADLGTWITSGRNVCPSCVPRHGVTKPWSYWRRVGLPGSPGLICGSECECQIVGES